VGVPITFDGSASSDPDGNPLTYAWDFDALDGITVDATGVTATHAYLRAATYLITLTVTDNGDGDPAQVCSRSATTNADISSACQATVFNGYDTIRLNSGKPFWFAYVQPAFDCYDNPDVNIPSFSMIYGNAQIFAKGKVTVGGDKSRDGIDELKVSFSKDDLRLLFAGLPNGHNTVTVTITAGLFSGGTLTGTTQLDVFNNGSFTASTVAPNPLNPSAILTYVTTRPGPVRVDLFNVQGQLVRRLVDEPTLAAGTHDVTLDGRGGRGEKLPSGVYYIRGVSAEGEFRNLITILK
jgi:PKD repeat protein